MRSVRKKTLPGDETGIVFIEFLFVVLPLMAMLLGLTQLSLIYVGSLAVQRSASAAARAAMVVLDDDPDDYGVGRNQAQGARLDAIKMAASFPLLALKTSAKSGSVALNLDQWKDNPLLAGKQGQAVPGLEVTFPGGVSGERGAAITVHVKYKLPCDVPFAGSILCGGETRTLEAESTLPNHAADYDYGEW